MFFQKGQYSLDHYRIFDTGDDPDVTVTFATFIGLLERPQLAGSCHSRLQRMTSRFWAQSSPSLVAFNLDHFDATNSKNLKRPIQAQSATID